MPSNVRISKIVRDSNFGFQVGKEFSGQESARDDVSLDFRGSFEDVQDPGVAQNAADLVFERKSVSAMDLKPVVGGRPGHSRTQKLCHASL